MISAAKTVDLTAASDRARQIRELYTKLEQRMHGGAWSPQELMIGYLYDVGKLGRLIMAKEDRWVHHGDLPKELDDKLSECLWWVLVLAERMGVDISKAFTAKMDALEGDLAKSVEKENS